MKKHQREAILISFLNEKWKYKKLAEYIVQLIQNDPSSPKESLHTIIYRIKDELRLIEKINRLNDIDLRYSGYSSIHYQVELGENSDAPPGLKGLLFELQLRTILEEAWSEIDHKYRYVRSRIGVHLPGHIHTGFYNLSAYLQVAATQAEYLCRLVEAHSLKKISKVKGIPRIPLGDEFSSTDMKKNEACRKLSSSEIEKILKKILGFKVTPRTLIYIEKRLGDVNSEEKPHKILQKLLTKNRLLEFKSIFQEILNIEPFANARENNIDVINALNFGMFYELQGKRVAQEGLRAVLRWRKDRSIC